MEVINQAIVTDAGMFAIWDSAAFTHILDYDAWETELSEDEDILKHIQIGKFVPINIQSDGGFQFIVRIGNAENLENLNVRESQYIVVSSESYLFDIEGNAFVSGVEHISGNHLGNLPNFSLDKGRYVVNIHMLDWQEKPGSSDENGQATANALPDFLILINPETVSINYRQKVLTFDRK
jgi:hypothetical protein